MEMPKDINTFDSDDVGLKMIFGERFHDETTAKGAQTPSFRRATPSPAIGAKTEPKTEPNTVKEAKWKPVKPDPNDMDRLKSSAKSALLFGGLCLLVFYWQQTGQMAASAALPSMLVCIGLAGLNVGKNMKGVR